VELNRLSDCIKQTGNGCIVVVVVVVVVVFMLVNMFLSIVRFFANQIKAWKFS
jgi:hypothetical protein